MQIHRVPLRPLATRIIAIGLAAVLPPATIVAAAAVAAKVSPGRIHSRLIQPFGSGGTEASDNRGYVLSANMDEIREISSLLFTDVGARPTTGRPDAPPEKPATVPDLPRFNGC